MLSVHAPSLNEVLDFNLLPSFLFIFPYQLVLNSILHSFFSLCHSSVLAQLATLIIPLDEVAVAERAIAHGRSHLAILTLLNRLDRTVQVVTLDEAVRVLTHLRTVRVHVVLHSSMSVINHISKQ